MQKEEGREEEVTMEEVFILSMYVIVGMGVIFVDKLWR